MNAQVPLDAARPARFTVDEFLKLDRSGALDRFAKTELIDGEIIVVNAQYSEHFTAKTRLLRRLADACDALDNGFEAWAEGTIAIPPDNLPEPDIFITTVTPIQGLVVLATVALVVEVASTTLRQDLTRKAKLYAQSGIPEYWVVDVNARVIHQMWSPNNTAYADRRQIAFGDAVTAATCAGVTIATTGL